MTKGKVHRWTFRDPQGDVEIEPRGQLVTDHGELLRDAAVAGVGLIRVLDLMVAPELERGALRTVLEGHHAAAVPINALQPLHRRSSPKARAFVDFLAATLEERERAVAPPSPR